MTVTQLVEYLVFAIETNEPVLIKSKPGVGKTSIVKQVAKMLGIRLLISHPVVSDPTDYKGLPFATGNGRADFLPYGDLWELIHTTERLIFFIDDLGQAPEAVQKAIMQLLLAREINGHKISDLVSFVAATNRKEDKAGVAGVLEPVKSRFSSIVELEVTTEDWVLWALDNDMPTDLIAFNRLRPELINNFKPSRDIINSPSPRTIASIGRQQAAGLPEPLYFEVFKGAAGEEYAIEYCAFLDMKKHLPNIEQIILNPTGAPVPDNASVLYMLAGALANKMSDANIDSIAAYLERLPGEIAVCTIKDAVTRKPALKDTRGFIKLATGKVGNMIL